MSTSIKDTDAAISTDPLFSFEIPRGVLRAMALFQSGADRVGLAATSHEIVKMASGHHQLTFAATNGRILASYNTEILSESLFGELPDELTFSCDLSGIKKLPKNGGADLVTVAVFPAHVEYSSGSLQYTAKRIEGEYKFPAWRACIPTGKPEPAEFFVASAKYLKAFGDAAKLISEKLAIAIQSYGQNRPIVIQIPDDTGFYGVLMPMKDVEWSERPDWLDEKAKPQPRDGSEDGNCSSIVKQAEADAVYAEAVSIVRKEGKAGASLLQRKLRIGYNAASALLDRMEEAGIVGPENGANPRSVLPVNKTTN